MVKEPLKALAFSADSQVLIAAGTGGLISRWHAQTGELRETWWLRNSRSAAGVILDRHSTMAAVRNDEGFIEIHDLRLHQLLSTIGPVAGAIDCVEFDPEGRYIVIAEGAKGASLWDIRGARRMALLEGDIGRAIFGPAGRILCSPGADWARYSIVWDWSSGQRTMLPHGWSPWNFACLSPDATLFVTTGWHQSFIRSSDTLECRSTLEGHTDDVNSLAFSPDRRTIASGDGSGVVKLWDVAVGEELLTLEPHAGPVRSIRFSPDGKTLASGADRPDGTAEVFLWRAQG